MAKRVFTKAQADRAGQLVLSDTPETSKMIDWFMKLYELDMDHVTRARLGAQVSAAQARERDVAEVLAGRGRDYGVREPARPPMPYYERGSRTPFQEVAARLVCTTNRVLIGDDLGFGKTFTAVLTLNSAGALPALIVCQAHLPEQIGEEIAATLPWLRTHIIAKREPYTTNTAGEQVPYVSAAADGVEPDVLIISYAKLPGWRYELAGKVQTVVFDEVQELRHTSTEKYRAAGSVADGASRVFGLSNTPVYNYGDEAWNICNIIAPGFLGTFDEFKREWCTTRNGKTLLTKPGAFGAFLRDSGLMLARTYEHIGQYDDAGTWTALPRPVIDPVPVNVDYDPAVIQHAMSDATEMARLVLAQTSAENHRQKFHAAGQLDLRMRQATGIAKAPAVAAFVRMLLQTQQRVVLFGWHRAVYDLWLEQLAEFNPVLYTGTEGPAAKRASKAQFCGGNARVLIISLRSGTGLDGLQNHCQSVVFGELDWSPAVQRQGIGRVARGLRRQNTVTVHYLISGGGTDPLMAELLQLKRYQAEPIMSADGDVFTTPAPDPNRVRLIAQQVIAHAHTTELADTGQMVLT